MAPPEKQTSTPQSIVESFASASIEEASDLLHSLPTTKAELVALKDAAVARSKELKRTAGEQINISLAFLERQLDARLKEFERRPIDAVGNVLGDAVSGAGNLAGNGIKASGEQMGKAFDTAKQVVYNEAEAFSKKSGWERAQQVGGLAALAVLVGYPIYKLAEKVSNAGKKEGEKPGFFRNFLKVTGILALSTAVVNFLGPRVLAAQKAGGKQSPNSPSTQKSEEAAKPEAPAPEAPAAEGTADDSAEKRVTDDQMAQGEEAAKPEAKARKRRGNAEMRAKIRAEAAIDAADAAKEVAVPPANPPQAKVPGVHSKPKEPSSPVETEKEGWEFGRHRMCFIERNGQRFLSVNNNIFHTKIILPILGARDVSSNITTVQKSIDGGLAIGYSHPLGKGLAEISQSECQRIADALSDATSTKTMEVQTTKDGELKKYNLEFSPEKTS
ncbi:hypothetical protein FJZ27_01415 [Candidatus Peribacteria bacterium]|nr:hypothetical protein [Candidatus Peribacteria bacterium]